MARGVTANDAIDFGVLGPLEMVVNAHRAALPRGRQRVLLATLLVHANEAVSNARLHRSLWGERQPNDPQNALATCMVRLRQRLARVSGVLGQSIETTAAGYQMRVAREELDLLRFRQQKNLAATAAAAGDLATARTTLDGALALWRGPVLAEIDSDYLHNTVLIELTEERLLAIERRQMLDLMSGRDAEIIGELRLLVREFPGRERFWHHLMLALYRTGRCAEALTAFHESIGYLRDEFGADPSDGLRQLHLAMLRRDPALGHTPPPDQWLPSIGWLRGGVAFPRQPSLLSQS